jgi:hypothetical protein
MAPSCRDICEHPESRLDLDQMGVAAATLSPEFTTNTPL